MSIVINALPISSIKSPGNTSSGSSESLEITMQKQKEASCSCSPTSVFTQTQALRDSISRAYLKNKVPQKKKKSLGQRY